MTGLTNEKLLVEKLRSAMSNRRTHDVSTAFLRWKKSANGLAVVLSQIALALQRHTRECKKCSPKVKARDRQRAQRILKKLVSTDSKNVAARYGQCMLLKGDRFVECVEQLIKKTGAKEYYAQIGNHYRDTGQPKVALRYYEKALPHIPNHYGILYSMAKAHLMLGEIDKAKDFAKLALRRFQSMPASYKRDPVTLPFIRELKKITL